MARDIGDHTRPADLAAGARRGRDGDDGKDAGRIGTLPPVTDVLEVPHRAALAGHKGDDLARIEAATTPDGDDTVMAARVQHLHTGLNVRGNRIGPDIGEDRGFKATLAQHVEQLGDQWQSDHTRIRDEEGVVDAGRHTGLD
jgi:hypothetical protein